MLFQKIVAIDKLMFHKITFASCMSLGARSHANSVYAFLVGAFGLSSAYVVKIGSAKFTRLFYNLIKIVFLFFIKNLSKHHNKNRHSLITDWFKYLHSITSTNRVEPVNIAVQVAAVAHVIGQFKFKSKSCFQKQSRN